MSGVRGSIAPYGNGLVHSQNAIQQRHWPPPRSNSVASLATAKAQFGSTPGHRQGAIPERPCLRHCAIRKRSLPQPRRNSGQLLVAGTYPATAIEQFGSVTCNRQTVIRQRPLQLPAHNSATSLANATAPFWSAPGHCQSAILDHPWSPPRRNSGTSLAIAMTSFGNMSGDHQGDFLECPWPPPMHQSRKQFATARSPFRSVHGNSQGTIPEHHWQPPERLAGAPLANATIWDHPWPRPKRESAASLTTAKTSFGCAASNRQCVILKCYSPPPGRYSWASLVMANARKRPCPSPARRTEAPVYTAKAQFCSVPGHCQIAILEHRWQHGLPTRQRP